MRKPTWRWGAAIVALVLAGAGSALGAAAHPQWGTATAEAGMRFYAWAVDLGQRTPLGILIPVVAMSLSFHAGSRVADRMARRREARVAVATRPPLARYAILFGVTAFMSLILAALRGW